MSNNNFINQYQRNMGFNPNMMNPNMMNPNIINPNIINPNMSNPNTDNRAMLTQMYQNMLNQKRMHQSNIAAKINELEKNKNRLRLNDDELKNAIIRPIKIEKCDTGEMNQKFENIDRNFLNELQLYWSKRTNQPYKNILKNEKYDRDFKTKDDLIVHKVSKLDKLGVDEDYENKMTNIEKHNKELKVIYSQSKELENKKKFEYNNKYKFRVKYDPKNHDELKEDKIEYYKKEQEKVEKDKKNIDNLIETLLNSDLLTEDERKELKEMNLETDDEFNKTEQIQAKAKILEFEMNKKKNLEIKTDKNSIVSFESDDEISSDEDIKKKITIKSKTISSKGKDNKEKSNDNKNIDDLLNVDIDDDVRNKYLNRKKK